MSKVRILTGDWVEQLALLPDKSVHCCVTSPPYFGLRDYQCEGQLGLEKTPEEYINKLVAGFREVRRVLRDDGTFWLNLGDSYASGKGSCYNPGGNESSLGKDRKEEGAHPLDRGNKSDLDKIGLKPKDLIGIPWRAALALQADGWYLRSDIIWAKKNTMPESVTDRPTRSHEYIFLLTKSKDYFYDAQAIMEPCTMSTVDRLNQDIEHQNGSTRGNGGAKMNGPMKAVMAGVKPDKQRGHSRRHDGFNDRWDTMEKSEQCSGMRNKRDVWHVATMPYKEAHFATFPPELIKPCILAGTSARGCCAMCGAPYERVVEKGFTGHDGQTDSAYEKGSTAGRLAKLRQASRQNGGEYVNGTKTVGWRATCECRSPSPATPQTACASSPQGEEPAIVPCTVLDPFGGSGTTGMVALELGRAAILIELNPDYVKLIEQRTNVTMGLAL